MQNLVVDGQVWQVVAHHRDFSVQSHPLSEEDWTPWMDGLPLDVWTSLAYSDRTLLVTFSIVTLLVTRLIAVSNALNLCQ